MYHGNEIKNIWSIAMLKFKNRKQVKLYEDNSWLTKKQHERLSGSVYHTFREFILPDISVKLVSKFFSERHGRPTKDIQSMIGLFILQHTFDMSDDQTIEAYTYNDAFRYALDISRNEYLAVRTYYYYRSIILGKGKRIFENILKTILRSLQKVFLLTGAASRAESVFTPRATDADKKGHQASKKTILRHKSCKKAVFGHTAP